MMGGCRSWLKENDRMNFGGGGWWLDDGGCRMVNGGCKMV